MKALPTRKDLRHDVTFKLFRLQKSPSYDNTCKKVYLYMINTQTYRQTVNFEISSGYMYLRELGTGKMSL